MSRNASHRSRVIRSCRYSRCRCSSRITNVGKARLACNECRRFFSCVWVTPKASMARVRPRKRNAKPLGGTQGTQGMRRNEAPDDGNQA